MNNVIRSVIYKNKDKKHEATKYKNNLNQLAMYI